VLYIGEGHIGVAYGPSVNLAARVRSALLQIDV
jgi:hypothetical protein